MHHGSHAEFVAVDTSPLRQADLPRLRQLLQCVVGDVAGVDAVKSFQEPVHHLAQLPDDPWKSLQRPAAWQCFGVVHDGLNAQNAFAFVIDLQRQIAVVNFEHR